MQTCIRVSGAQLPDFLVSKSKSTYFPCDSISQNGNFQMEISQFGFRESQHFPDPQYVSN